jgi:hypothetical protein
LIGAFEAGADGNTFGSFYFVASQHPNLDSSHSQGFNGDGYFIL